ncbi:hypothetical protein BDAG_01741 [Burkholderia dolosa AU0158]|nr:hypothetical protein BDAG_01741 [Burkholderia dolosa AU0158]
MCRTVTHYRRSRAFSRFGRTADADRYVALRLSQRRSTSRRASELQSSRAGRAGGSRNLNMNKRGMAGWIGGIALLASGSAMAGHVDLSVGIGVPVAPVYVEPAPVYVAPQPAVVAYPGYGYGGYYGDDDDDRYRKWRKHYYKHWRQHHDDDDD